MHDFVHACMHVRMHARTGSTHICHWSARILTNERYCRSILVVAEKKGIHHLYVYSTITIHAIRMYVYRYGSYVVYRTSVLYRTRFLYHTRIVVPYAYSYMFRTV